MKQHDLFDFFKNANNEISKEYERICRRTIEDPGTAGDQGEANWKRLLEMWLPPYFHVVNKGRIIGDTGETSPQIDLLVLSPEYPKQLIDCKQYLAGGVVAAFECKTTLKREHIKELMIASRKISELAPRENGNPRKDLKRSIYYGLLSHSHEWKQENSNPINNIRRAISQFDHEIIKHPIEMPDLICVSDLRTWSSVKVIVPAQKNIEKYKELSVISSYGENADTHDFYTPVGSMIFSLLEFLSWEYSGLRKLVSYLKNLNLEGVRDGNMRQWSADVLSEKTIRFINPSNAYGNWNEHNLVVV